MCRDEQTDKGNLECSIECWYSEYKKKELVGGKSYEYCKIKIDALVKSQFVEII